MNTISLGLSFNDVLLIPQYSDIRSRSEVDLSTKIAPGFILKIPLIATHSDSVTGHRMAIEMDKLGGIGMLHRFRGMEHQVAEITHAAKAGARCIATIGTNGDYISHIAMLLKAGANAIVIDNAHGHTSFMMETIKNCKKKYPKVPLFAGVVATYEGAKDLFTAGVDGVKVNVGGGSICTTRIQAGCGVPQITAISEAARAKKEFKNKFVIADAGMTNSGDVVKALAAGADAIQSGNLFAGTDEAPGPVIEKEGVLYKEYNGSTSPTEKMRQLAKDANSQRPNFAIHVEGVDGMVPYKGPVKDIVESLCAGIRSGLSYCGARSIPELWEKAQFLQITAAGYQESKAHDIILR